MFVRNIIMNKRKYLKTLKCQGDFCAFLKEHEHLDSDVDYDILVSFM